MIFQSNQNELFSLYPGTPVPDVDDVVDDVVAGVAVGVAIGVDCDAADG